MFFVGMVLAASFVTSSAFAEDLALGTGLGNGYRIQCIEGTVERAAVKEAEGSSDGSISQIQLADKLGLEGGRSQEIFRNSSDNTPEAAFYNEAKNNPGNTVQSDTKVPFQLFQTSEVLKNGELTEVAKKVLTESPQRFEQLCGNKLIQQRALGADILTNLHVEMKGSDEQKKACKSALEYRSFVSIKFEGKRDSQANDLAAWSKNESPISLNDGTVIPDKIAACAGAVVHVSALQRGGLLDRFSSIFKYSRHTSGNVGFGSISCSIKDLTKCLEAASASEVLAYEFAKQVDLTKGPAEDGGLAVIDYVAKPYSNFGIFPEQKSSVASLLSDAQKEIGTLSGSRSAQDKAISDNQIKTISSEAKSESKAQAISTAASAQ
jgi:hypothetical protein